MKPLALIDVDGVLSPFLMHRHRRQVDPAGREPHWVRHRVPWQDGHAYTLELSPLHGDWLRGLVEGFDLIWCTTWWRVANQRIAPLIDLPGDLPAVLLPTTAEAAGPYYIDGRPDLPARYRCPYKVRYVRAFALGRPVVWFDDDVTAETADWLTGVHADLFPESPPVDAALCVEVDARTGLQWHHIERAREWAQQGGGQ